MKEKVDAGWVFGEIKDADAKTHPCIVPYDELPEFQKKKDHLFIAIVKALSQTKQAESSLQGNQSFYYKK